MHPAAHASGRAFAHFRPSAEVATASAEAPRLGHLNRLPSPVLLVTRGRGLERFNDSAKLLRRLEELPALRDEVMQIEQDGRTLAPRSVAALNAMLNRFGLDRFNTACRRLTTPARALRTRYQWAHLSDYMGFEWEVIK